MSRSRKQYTTLLVYCGALLQQYTTRLAYCGAAVEELRHRLLRRFYCGAAVVAEAAI